VKAGKHDSVASIARRYKLNAAQVADWNDVGASAVFKAGQQVVVYLPLRTAARGASGGAKAGARAGARKVAPSATAKRAVKPAARR
jgi:membrane-bound lytic murein transglycosylase D